MSTKKPDEWRPRRVAFAGAQITAQATNEAAGYLLRFGGIPAAPNVTSLKAHWF